MYVCGTKLRVRCNTMEQIHKFSSKVGQTHTRGTSHLQQTFVSGRHYLFFPTSNLCCTGIVKSADPSAGFLYPAKVYIYKSVRASLLVCKTRRDLGWKSCLPRPFKCALWLIFSSGRTPTSPCWKHNNLVQMRRLSPLPNRKNLSR